MNEAKIAVKCNLRIMPFGCASIELRTEERETGKEEKGFPVYSQPATTIPGLTEIAFNRDDYMVPRTTDGSP
jgi:hypothetical protein